MPTVKVVNQPQVTPAPLQTVPLGPVKPVLAPTNFNTNVQPHSVQQAMPTSVDTSGLQSGLNQLAIAFDNIKNRADQTALVDAENRYDNAVNEILHTGEDAFFKKKGEDVFKSSKATKEQLDRVSREIENGLNPTVAEQFRLSVDKRNRSNERSIVEFTDKAQQDWDNEVADARIKTAIENASLKNQDTALITESANTVVKETMLFADRNGEAEEVTEFKLKNRISTVYASAIQGAVRDENYRQAQYLLDKFKGRLTKDDADAVEGLIKEGQTAKQAQSIADKIRVEGGTRTERLGKVNQIEDPELRKIVKTQVISDFEQQERGEAESEADAYNRATDYKNSGVPFSWLIRQPEWKQMNSAQRDSFVKHYNPSSELETDIVAYDKLTGLLEAGKQHDARVYFTKNVHKFSLQDQKNFSKLTQQTTEEQGGLFSAKEALTVATKDLSDDKKRLFQTEFDRWYLKYVEDNDNKKPSDDEVNRQIDQMMMKQGGLFGIGSSLSFVKKAEDERKANENMLDVYQDVFGSSPDLTDIQILNRAIEQYYEKENKYPSKSWIRNKLTNWANNGQSR